jgi:hypothetical protein
LPEIDTLKMSFTTEKVTHRSKRSSVASKDVSAVTFLDGTGEISISEHSADILKVALYGNKATIAGGAVSATAFENDAAVVGSILAIPGGKVGISSLVVTDSAGSPATLTLDTDYEIVDADAGLIKILSLGSYTQPFKAAFTERAGTGVGIFTQRVFELAMRFKGINILNNDRVEVLDLYKIQLEPTNDWQGMGDGTDVQKVTLAFGLLKDSEKAVDATFGQYGKLSM